MPGPARFWRGFLAGVPFYVLAAGRCFATFNFSHLLQLFAAKTLVPPGNYIQLSFISRQQCADNFKHLQLSRCSNGCTLMHMRPWGVAHEQAVYDKSRE